MASEDATFAIMNSQILAGLIKNANEEIILFTPGVDERIAKELIEAKNRLSPDRLHVIVDVSEKICRFGYGTIEGFQLLQKHFSLRDSPGLRISGILVDGRGWVFSPTPLLLEAGKVDEHQPNAVRVSKDQFLVLKKATLGEAHLRKEAGLEDHPALEPKETPDTEIGSNEVHPDKTARIAEDLKGNPPQRFDIARKVNVFNTQLEYVELSLIGCRFQAMKVNLPPKLIVGEKDAYLNKNLRSIFNLAGKDSELIPKEFLVKFENFKKTYLKPILKHGSVMLKSKKVEFTQQLGALQEELETIKNNLESAWTKEIGEYQKKLVESLIPNVVQSPPMELTAQINGSPTKEIARRYLQSQMQGAFPTFEEATGRMKIECLFKGITYETLCDEAFQKEVQKQYGLIPWDKLFQEYDAVEGQAPSPQGSLFDLQ